MTYWFQGLFGKIKFNLREECLFCDSKSCFLRSAAVMVAKPASMKKKEKKEETKETRMEKNGTCISCNFLFNYLLLKLQLLCIVLVHVYNYLLFFFIFWFILPLFCVLCVLLLLLIVDDV